MNLLLSKFLDTITKIENTDDKTTVCLERTAYKINSRYDKNRILNVEYDENSNKILICYEESI